MLADIMREYNAIQSICSICQHIEVIAFNIVSTVVLLKLVIS